MQPSWKTRKIQTSAGMETVDETVARAKRQLSSLSGSTPTQTTPTSLKTLDYNQAGSGIDTANKDLGGFMGGDLNNRTKTIMETFASRAGLIKEGGKADRDLNEMNFGEKIEDQLGENARNYTMASEGRSGYGTKTAAVRFLEDSGSKRIKELEKQRDMLDLQSKSLEAGRLDSLIADEQEAITTARTKWITDMLSLSGESRAESAENRAISQENREILGFETPDTTRKAEQLITRQKSLDELAIAAPDAGILPTDDFATAVTKYRNSTTYKNNERLGELAIQQAEADIANTKSLTSNRGLGTGTGGGGGYFGGAAGGDTETFDGLQTIALNNVPNLISSKHGKETYLASLKGADTPDKVRDLMVSTIIANNPATFQDTYNKRSEAAGEIGEALSLLDDGAKTGWLPDKIQKVANVFGFDYDPKLAAIKAYITAATQPYRSDVTGAAWGAQETAEYEALLGTTNYEPQALKERLVRFQQMLYRKNKNAIINTVAPVSQYNIYGEDAPAGGGDEFSNWEL